MYTRVNKHRFLMMISTLGPIGYCKAPGTMATIATLPIVFFLHFIFTWRNYFFFLFLSAIAAFHCIKQSLRYFKQEDPSEIVINESIGCLITFCALPMHMVSLLLGFLLFRFFDIVKCFGIKSCEQFNGAWGILIDDIVAGLFANICVHVILFLSSLIL